ncbi:uncharacterized protein Z520_04882 [Fonsecaea multimorphosa CBS 102226]|uniref:Uncharacterized protein n=1 Tax=Fonsecaea multimorphosa CBS 102226 TaxID=1442371 RepID=A0A0D2IQP6_9EURO|nr:uncharacterized protein Z520_04882 [Fonsecaea multimorphosa CBS 102226]KIX99306.1 hypothetical protein Z520_04882 [Fonsecaea multimorphosa CBS 102226]OAL25832.1 hypothetical protein AYO22_04626 [Fonsecaea multimorphosa]
MALALRSAAPLKPEIRLAQALSEFEAMLDDDDKKTFRTWRGGSPPAVSDVMKLTAEIDRNNSRRMSRRCFGPRLTSILGAVQQFSSALDVIVGGTQSPIATSIWGVLRMTLQITVQFASYFDNLSALFMRIGRSCPRYEQYGVMYPKSPRLQDAIYDYFRTVVQVCQKAVLLIRKGTFAQLSAALLNPFQSEFGPLELNLSTIADTVREEASLAFKQELALEKKEAFSFREWSLSKMSMKIEEAKRFRAQKAKFQFLNSCSTYNHQTAWKRARKAGESSYVFGQAAYTYWIQSTASSVLWITGILGSGKTVLTASVVQEVSIRFPDALVCYFFCSHDDAESLKAETIIGCLARQLLSLLNPDVFGSVDTIGPGALDTDEIVASTLRMLPQNEQIFVVVDGLDECNEIELDILFEYLGRLLKSDHHFHIFCSSRTDLHTRYGTALQPHHHLPLPVQNPEIAQYIEHALEDRLETGDLCLGDPDIILAIRHALLEGSHGMFLWVVFQLESICAALTDEGILKALESLPRDLPETFDRVLQKLSGQRTTNPATCQKIFAIVAAAQQPLTLDELREAMGVEPGDTQWNPRKLINDIRMAVNGCGSLLLIDEEDSAVRFSHHSVKQYIISSPRDASTRQFHVELSEADLSLGEICVTYLNFDVFNTTLTKMSDRAALQPQDITTSVVERTLPQGAVSKIALKLLKKKGARDFNLEARIREMVPQERRQADYAFLSYAKTFWLFHTRKFGRGRQVTYKLWLGLVSNSVKVVTFPWDPESWFGQEENVLEWALKNDHEALVRETTSKIAKSDAGIEHRGRTMELLEKFLDDEAMFSQLVESGLSVNQRNSDGHTVLMKAVHNGQTQTVKMLLERKDLEVNAGDNMSDTALGHAVVQDNEEMVKFLLTRPDIDVNCEDDGGWTAVRYAVYYGHMNIANILLDHGALDLKSMDKRGQTLLHWTARYLNEGHAVPLLLRRGLDSDELPDQGYLPRKTTTEYQRMRNAFERLLERDDVDVNIPDKHGRTVLHLLLLQWDWYFITEPIDLLLAKKDIQLNTRDNFDHTPLQDAIEWCEEGIVERLLLRDDLDVNMRFSDGNTALHYAARNRDTKWTELLLKRDDVDTEMSDTVGRKALEIAIQFRNEEFVRLLNDRRKKSAFTFDSLHGTQNGEVVFEGRPPLSTRRHRHSSF